MGRPLRRARGETGRYWNILGEKNIGLKGLICEKCGAESTRCTRTPPGRTWSLTLRSSAIAFPQLIGAWKSWAEILLDYKRYPRDNFYMKYLAFHLTRAFAPSPAPKSARPQTLRSGCRPRSSSSIGAVGRTGPSSLGSTGALGRTPSPFSASRTYVNSKFESSTSTGLPARSGPADSNAAHHRDAFGTFA